MSFIYHSLTSTTFYVISFRPYWTRRTDNPPDECPKAIIPPHAASQVGLYFIGSQRRLVVPSASQFWKRARSWCACRPERRRLRWLHIYSPRVPAAAAVLWLRPSAGLSDRETQTRSTCRPGRRRLSWPDLYSPRVLEASYSNVFLL